MRKLVITVSCIKFWVACFGQTELEKILVQKGQVPENWVAAISNIFKWNVADQTFIGNESRRIYPPNAVWKKNDINPHSYQFAVNTISKFPFLVDSLNTLPVIYFQTERTFYVVHKILVESKTIELKFPFKVHYLDSSRMVLEHLDDILFDYDAGKILTQQEWNQRTANKATIQPGSYEVTDRSKKKRKKGDEKLRLVELLSAANL